MVSPARVLIIRLSSMGDVVLTAPVCAAVKAAWPQAKLCLLTKPQYAPLMKGHPRVDEVLTYENFFQALGAVRQRSFTHLLDLQGGPKSLLLSLFSGVSRKLRYPKATWERRVWVRLRKKSPELENHTVDRYLRRLPQWGIPVPSRPEMALGAPAQGLPAALREVEGLLVGMHGGSRWPTKQWPAEKFAQLAGRLHGELGARIVLVGGPEDAEASEKIARLSEAPCVNLAGKTSLGETAAAISSLKLFITNDSGPMHLAAACGVPVLAVFGSTTRELGFFPRGEGHRVAEVELDCRPCHVHGRKKCPLGHFLCMNLITVQQVFETAKQMLKNEHPAHH